MGQLGLGDKDDTQRLSSVLVPNTKATQVCAGEHFTCAIIDGKAHCWGSSDEYRSGMEDERYSPHRIDSGAATQVACGKRFGCAIISSVVKCWGSGNKAGGGDVKSPKAISGLSGGILDVSAGGDHACAVQLNGRVMCWGDGGSGQLGRGDTSSSSSARQVSGISTATKVSCGNDHTCVVLSDRTVRCFGDNGNGQVGSGSSSSRITSPANVVGLRSGALDVECGSRHTAAMLDSGQIQMFGYNGGSTGVLAVSSI